MPDLVVRNAAVVSMDDSMADASASDPAPTADLRIRGGRLLEIGAVAAQAGDVELDDAPATLETLPGGHRVGTVDPGGQKAPAGQGSAAGGW